MGIARSCSLGRRRVALLVPSSPGQVCLWRILKADAQSLCWAGAGEVPPDLDTARHQLCCPLQSWQRYIHSVGEIP